MVVIAKKAPSNLCLSNKGLVELIIALVEPEVHLEMASMHAWTELFGQSWPQTKSQNHLESGGHESYPT